MMVMGGVWAGSWVLLGVTGQSIYKWENGKARPRASQFASIAALRKMSKKDAAGRLGALAR